MRPITSLKEFEGFLARFTNYERVQSFKYDATTLGLDRMRSFMALLGNPQESYPSVHVAGTKGKGTTCLILEAFLRGEGLRVGTYLSPHVEHLRERIRIDSSPAGDEDLIREVNKLLPALAECQRKGPGAFPSFFELMTGLAMSSYKTRRVDWGIFEVGLGGRFDATNILCPRVCAITSLGLEHTQQLGKTLGEIAREKAGIIKQGTPVVVGPLPAEARAEVERISEERAAPLLTAVEETVTSAGQGRLRVAGLSETFPAGALVGPALRMDLGIALTIFQRLFGSEGNAISGDRVRNALSVLSLPARIEVFPTRPAIVLDAAHTVESVQALRLALEEIQFPRPRTLVFSISAGKEIDPILKELPRLAEHVVLPLADPVRSLSPGVLREQLGYGEVIESPEEAFQEALSRGWPIVVTGSFYLAGRLRPVVRALPEGACG
jgi:dihydrofolate synthase/folylpolyglutamate synthase